MTSIESEALPEWNCFLKSNLRLYLFPWFSRILIRRIYSYMFRYLLSSNRLINSVVTPTFLWLSSNPNRSQNEAVLKKCSSVSNSFIFKNFNVIDIFFLVFHIMLLYNIWRKLVNITWIQWFKIIWIVLQTDLYNRWMYSNYLDMIGIFFQNSSYVISSSQNFEKVVESQYNSAIKIKDCSPSDT